MIHYITFANIFINNVFKKFNIYNNIEKLIKILLI